MSPGISAARAARSRRRQFRERGLSMKRKDRSPMVFWVGVLAFILGLVGYAIPTKSPDPPLRIHFASAGGAVLFPHDQHTDSERGFECHQCHHELLGADIESPCIRCHHCDSFDLAEWERLEGADVGHVKLFEMGRRMMRLHYREAVGTGGFDGEKIVFGR